VRRGSYGRKRGVTPNRNEGIRLILGESPFDEADAERLVRVVQKACEMSGGDELELESLVPFLARSAS
jgi:hypothetical protein